MQYPQNYENKNQFYPKRIPRFLNRLRSDKPQINIILFLLTIGSTWFVQGVWYSFEDSIWYSLSITTILLAHEMGHYLMCRKYKIRATLPFFIPFPVPQVNPFGTMGAVIKIEERIPNRKALFDVGAAGPLAGLFLTIPVLVIGFKLSHVVQVTTPSENALYLGNSFYLGQSLLISLIYKLMIGNLPSGLGLIPHPMAFAGWAGLFVTALNLLPIGQLDGGHVLYSIFGRHSQRIFKFVLSIFIIICALWYQGWLLLIILLIWLGYRHPPPIDDYTNLDKKRRIIGYIIFGIFIISFTPVPFYF